MKPAGISRTALRVAMRRAAHHVLDRPPVFDDPLALAILGADLAERVRADAGTDPADRAARAFMAVRARVAEDALAAFVGQGVRQYVVLGAGLDTFGYRNPFAADGLRVFEVDHPATQAWKRERLAAAGIGVPDGVTFAAVDFERTSVAAGLEAAGFDGAAPAFVAWLGVSMYLSADAVDEALRWVGSLPEPSGIAFDYALPRTRLSPIERAALDALSARVAAAGEPFISFFEPDDIARRLAAAGLAVELDIGRDDLNARYLAGRDDGLAIRGSLGRVVVARTASGRSPTR